MMESVFVLQKSPIYCRWELWDADAVELHTNKATQNVHKFTI